MLTYSNNVNILNDDCSNDEKGVKEKEYFKLSISIHICVEF